MTRDELTERALSATEHTLDVLERVLRHDGDHDRERTDHDPATNTVLFAADQLVFALVRYRAEHAIPQR
jgi:hypothetical protein